MPAQSQQQQKLFGLALAFKRGEVPASEVSDEIKDIADRMSEKEIEDFASTKHKGLPKMKEQLRKIVREIMRERVISEMNEESVNESTDCGCGCAGTTPGGCGGKSVNESRIKGRNNKTGESFGMVIGSDKKNKEGGFEVTIRKGYSSRISAYGFVFDKDSNLISIKDYGYSMDGKFPDMKGSSSVSSVRPNPRETITQIAKITSPAFAKKIYQHVKKVNESVNESASKEAMGIAALTGLRGDAVQKFIDDNNIHARKLFAFLKMKGPHTLSNRMDISTAIVGKTNNKFAKGIIKQFQESVINEGYSTEEKRIVMMAVRKLAKYRNVPIDQSINDLLGAGAELERDIKRGKITK